MQQRIEHPVGPLELAVGQLAHPLEDRVAVALALGEDRQHERRRRRRDEVLVDAHRPPPMTRSVMHSTARYGEARRGRLNGRSIQLLAQHSGDIGLGDRPARGIEISHRLPMVEACEHTTLTQRRVHDAAPNVTPGVHVATADDEDLHRYPEPSKLARQPDRLLSLVSDLRLNHQEADIAVPASVAPNIGAEQHDLGRLSSRARRAFDQPPRSRPARPWRNPSPPARTSSTSRVDAKAKPSSGLEPETPSLKTCEGVGAAVPLPRIGGPTHPIRRPTS